MMIYYLIPLFVIIASVGMILFLIFKRLPDLAAMNVASIAEEKASQVKNRIMLERLTSNLLRLRKLSIAASTPIIETIVKSFSNFTAKVGELEKQTQQSQRPLTRIDIKQKTDELLAKAQAAFDQTDVAKAEELYVEIIGLDQANLAAYEGLVQVYWTNKDYKKARETVRYCLKLINKKTGYRPANGEKHRTATYHANLGEIYELEHKPELALKQYQKAVELEPNNPRFLDLLLKISIMLKRKQVAWQAFNWLQEADPENQKLPDLRKEIEALPTEEQPSAATSSQ